MLGGRRADTHRGWSNKVESQSDVRKKWLRIISFEECKSPVLAQSSECHLTLENCVFSGMNESMNAESQIIHCSLIPNSACLLSETQFSWNTGSSRRGWA
eukprot:COSAG02_NODE_438_length_22319_cov_17.198425_9_plen_100_part_00